MAEQADHLMVIRKRRKEARIGRSKTKGEGEAGRGGGGEDRYPLQGQTLSGFLLPDSPFPPPPTIDSAMSSSTDDMATRS